MENIGVKNMVTRLDRLNPFGMFTYDDQDPCLNIIYGDVPTDKLVLPQEYEYNSKNGITNKHHTDSGVYEMFEYKYVPDYSFFVKPYEPPKKKSLLARIFGK